MNIYLVVIEDRHTDVDVVPFAELAAAITYANNELAEYEDAVREELTSGMIEQGWKYFATYSTEGDTITILERELR